MTTQTADPAAPPSPYLSGLRWLAENLDAAATAFIIALIIKSFCVEVYRIPSGSMEPTLMGDQKDEKDMVTTSGDKIMVTKYTYLFKAIQRYDVVVFRHPLQQSKHFIKRVVGLPDEEILISDGDLYARSKSSSDARFLITRKPPSVQNAIWINASPREDFLSDPELFRENWTRTPVTPVDSWKEGALDVPLSDDVQYEHKQEIRDAHGNAVHDLALFMTLIPREGAGRFTASLRTQHGTVAVDLGPQESTALLTDPQGKTDRIFLKTKGIRSGHTYRLQLSLYDGLAMVKLNGQEEAQKELAQFYDPRISMPSVTQRFSFGIQGLSASISDLRMARDVHYKVGDRDNWTENQPFTIPKKSYIFIGDHVEVSHDSRKWIRHELTLKNGSRVVCDGINYKDSDSSHQGFKHVIAEDRYGVAYKLRKEDVISHDKTPYPFVPEEYIMGKAFWVWFPAGVEPHKPSTWGYFKNLRLIR